MKNIGFTLLLAIVHLSLLGQYYIRGEIKNEHGDKVQNVTIVVHSTSLLYHSGIYGDFGITSSRQYDTLTFSLEGYESFTTKIKTTDFLKVTLKMVHLDPGLNKNHLTSYIKNPKIDENESWTIASETYSNLVENPFIQAQYSPVASFSVNINRASYSNLRRFLNMGMMVPPDAVRIEEMLNYFSFGYTEPDNNNIFKCSSQVSSCPWNAQHQILLLNISARKLDMRKIPASNLVFLIDASGSMDLPNKLPLLKSGFRLLVKNLRDIDTVSIVTYGDVVHVVLEDVSGREKEKLLEAIEEIEADGETPGEAGLRMAYDVVRRRFIKGGNNRIILASDGDFNVGLSTEKELQDLIEEEQKSEIYLTCLGVGMGNYKDSKLSVLAHKGNGNFAYIDNEQEAKKILVTELTQNLFAVADNVYLSINFHCPPVIEYRLIGFDNKKTALADSTNKLEGGEIGSGQSLTALFELIPRNDSEINSEPLADVKISYQLPGQSVDQTMNYTCPNNFIPFEDADTNIRKATSVAMFGMKLRESSYASQFSWKDIEDISYKCFSGNDFIDNDFLGLLAKAKKIYSRKKNKHKKN